MNKLNESLLEGKISLVKYIFYSGIYNTNLINNFYGMLKIFYFISFELLFIQIKFIYFEISKQFLKYSSYWRLILWFTLSEQRNSLKNTDFLFLHM